MMPTVIDHWPEFEKLKKFLESYQSLQKNFAPNNFKKENFSYGQVVSDLQTVKTHSKEKDILKLKEM